MNCIYFPFLAAPRFLADPSAYADLKLVAGDRLSINAEFLAFPNPMVKLMSQNGAEVDMEKFKCKIDGQQVLLEIEDAKRELSGKYSIILENSFGKASLALNITVLSEKKIFFITFL